MDTTKLPNELLYNIVGYVISEYVDQVICCDGSQIPSQPDDDPTTNPVLPLLQVSFQFRDGSRKVISDIFGIPRGSDGR